MRGEVVRRFCNAVAPGFFQTDPAAYGANKWFFEIGFPNVASMQGYEPFIDPNVSGAGYPHDDVGYGTTQSKITGLRLKNWNAGAAIL